MGSDINDIPFGWVRRELRLQRTLTRGDKGRGVQRVQEWLTLNGIAVVVDSDFGPATEYAVGRFQRRRKIAKTGAVDTETFDKLTKPLRRALDPPSASATSLSSTALDAARRHLRERPREVGGANRGPWVRVYMEGIDGENSRWCAGFTGFLLRQSSWHSGIELGFRPTFSCDAISRDAQEDGRFISEEEIASGELAIDDLPRGSLFVHRRSPDDWDHVGVVVAVTGDVMETIEGNTNEGGSREGYEVCRRIRNLKNKDFVRIG